MVEAQRRRVEEKMSLIIESMDKFYLRKMQGDMHRCAASCCDNDTYSLQKVQSCVQNCGEPLSKAQQYVQSEFERTQNRLQRCIMECNDRIIDKAGPNPTQDKVNQLNDDFEKCATKCVDSYCDLLPALEKSMKQILASGQFN
ncbi:protein FAM136A-like [Microplitis mediator]|uniref:protein FAM136A-like n=1 Tax=Microplitis mediator TaxID=375433 RepID=UPI00255262E5|nr:protein FAM136A-like [Microplitis mediator]